MSPVMYQALSWWWARQDTVTIVMGHPVQWGEGDRKDTSQQLNKRWLQMAFRAKDINKQQLQGASGSFPEAAWEGFCRKDIWTET